MKNKLFLIVLLIAFKISAQNDSKIAFQKSRYELAVSYYKKADFKKAIDLFYVASKIKPENEIGQESIRKVDTLKTILRDDIMKNALGTWKMIGDKPVWAIKQESVDAKKDFDEFVEITEEEILFYEKNNKTQEKKATKSEKLTYYNEDYDGTFSDIILSDGMIWHCIISDNADELRVINVAKKDENGVQKIESNNIERFFVKVK